MTRPRQPDPARQTHDPDAALAVQIAQAGERSGSARTAARLAVEIAEARQQHRAEMAEASSAVAAAMDWSRAAGDHVPHDEMRRRRDWNTRAAEQGKQDFPGIEADPAASNRQEDDMSVLDKVRGVFHRDDTAGYPEPDSPVFTASDAQRQLAARGYDEDEARRMVADYQADTSSRLGIPADLLGLDRNDLDAMARGRDEQRYAEAKASTNSVDDREAHIENDARSLADRYPGEHSSLDQAREAARSYYDENDVWAEDHRRARETDAHEENARRDALDEADSRDQDDTRQADAGGDDTKEQDMSTDTAPPSSDDQQYADAAPDGPPGRVLTPAEKASPDVSASWQPGDTAVDAGKRSDSTDRAPRGWDAVGTATDSDVASYHGTSSGKGDAATGSRLRGDVGDVQSEMDGGFDYSKHGVGSSGKGDAAARAAAADSGAAVAAADATDDKAAASAPSGDAWDDRDADAKGRRRDDADY